jgi:formylglycine-generating enzyme required for sulfatase activity
MASIVAITGAALSAAVGWGGPVNYELVPVRDAGNTADATGYGAVPYEYYIGKYEVTIGQYAAFLNAVAKTATYGLYNANMSTDANYAGISRTGVSGSYAYNVIGPFGGVQIPQATASNRPISWVTWFNSARFANWMSNGQPTGLPGATTTENGAYALNGRVSGTAPSVNLINPNTGSVPLYRIPTEDEWYKAAFYKGGGTGAGYWAYATQSNSAPGNTIGSGLNQANYYAGDYAVTQSTGFPFNQNVLADVGAFAGSPSAYGTFDQSGSVYEWNDLLGLSGTSRGLRSGYWNESAQGISSSSRLVESAGFQSDWGFRLAAVPEPSTWVMGPAGVACAGWVAFRWRKRT